MKQGSKKKTTKKAAAQTRPTAKQIKEERINETAQWVVDFLDPRNIGIATPNIIQDALACFLTDAMNETQFKLLTDAGEGEQVNRDELIAFLHHADKTGLHVDSGGFFRGGEGHGKRSDEGGELKDFAHHMAEVLRIARVNPNIPASLYNDLFDAWLNFENDMPNLAEVNESEAHVMSTIDTYLRQIKERAAVKGGAK